MNVRRRWGTRRLLNGKGDIGPAKTCSDALVQDFFRWFTLRPTRTEGALLQAEIPQHAPQQRHSPLSNPIQHLLPQPLPTFVHSISHSLTPCRSEIYAGPALTQTHWAVRVGHQCCTAPLCVLDCTVPSSPRPTSPAPCPIPSPSSHLTLALVLGGQGFGGFPLVHLVPVLPRGVPSLSKGLLPFLPSIGGRIARQGREG